MEIRGVKGQYGLGKVSGNGLNKPAAESADLVSAGGDQVQISPAARYIEQYVGMSAVRGEKVAAARESINAGTMDTDEKLSLAIDRLLDDLLGE